MSGWKPVDPPRWVSWFKATTQHLAVEILDDSDYVQTLCGRNSAYGSYDAPLRDKCQKCLRAEKKLLDAKKPAIVDGLKLLHAADLVYIDDPVRTFEREKLAELGEKIPPPTASYTFENNALSDIIRRNAKESLPEWRLGRPYPRGYSV